MKFNDKKDWLPEKVNNFDGEERTVGVELEFSGVEPKQIIESITEHFNGKAVKQSVFNYQIKDTDVGDFILELDAQLLQKMVSKTDDPKPEDAVLDNTVIEMAENLLKFTAEQLVPWEVVSPPVKVSHLYKLGDLVESLRNHGALGTRHAARYAFGLHINPELSELSADNILSHLKAYICLYDWIYDKEQIDVVRRITPYIDSFKKDYIVKIIDDNYKPSMSELIADYIEFNPTRNRSLDLLPLFAHIDAECVKGLKDQHLIKSRPTFHYRLPNCDIDNQDWNLDIPWSYWLQVERVANNKKLLDQLVNEFSDDLHRLTRSIDSKWVKRCDELLAQ